MQAARLSLIFDGASVRKFLCKFAQKEAKDEVVPRWIHICAVVSCQVCIVRNGKWIELEAKQCIIHRRAIA